MIHSPLATEPLLRIGFVSISAPVVTTWVIMIVLVAAILLVRRRVSLTPTKYQVLLELLVSSLDRQIRDTMQTDPAPYRSLIGTLFVIILACNWSGMIPAVEPPTAHLETDAALAGVVLGSSIVCGIRARGFVRYLASFAEWVLIIQGVVFVLVVMLFRKGIVGQFHSHLTARRQRRAAAS